jgi:DNA-binding response OmpR family regulator
MRQIAGHASSRGVGCDDRLGRATNGQGSSMKEKSTIALVDDERNILTSLSIALEAEGYKVRTYNDGAAALEALAEEPADLAILDIKMPRMDGMELLRRLRQQTDMPVIFLTSKDEEIDELFGLKMGADDYITKPFSVREFRSRVRAALRRSEMGGAARLAPDEPIAIGDLKIDFERRVVEVRDDKIRLTYVEFEILAALALSPGRVMTRENLLEHVWGDSAYRDPRTIDVHIRHLREKLEADPRSPEYLFTVMGVGYRFRDPE